MWWTNLMWLPAKKIKTFKTAEHWFWLLGCLQTLGFWMFIFTAFCLGVNITFGIVWFIACFVLFSVAGKIKGTIFLEFQEEFNEFRQFLDNINSEMNFRRNRHEWNRN